MFTAKESIILASASPSRKQLMEQMGLEFKVVPSSYDEKLDDNRNPKEVAIELATGKAEEVAGLHLEAIVIGADTIVTFEGCQLEKPRDAEDAKRMLGELAGKTNIVTTGVAVIKNGNVTSFAVNTDVVFKPYDERQVSHYVATGDPLDKAGAYGIQSGAASLIEHIKGEYDNVVGLPTKQLASALTSMGIEANAVILDSPVPIK